MNISETSRIRQLLGWTASALLIAALLCLADGLAAGFKGEQRDLQATPGAVLPLTSPLPAGASSLEEMHVEGGDQWVTLTPESLFSGFWLGGTMWRGSIYIAADAPQGSRTFTLSGTVPVLPDAGTPPPRPLAISVTVHPDAAAMQQASPSLITRKTGIHPFVVSLTFLVLALPFGLGVYLASRKIERIMATEGRAFVYMAKEASEGLIIAFSLGLNHGLSTGMLVEIFDAKGSRIGDALVTGSDPEDSTARLISGTCTMGNLVSIIPPTPQDVG